jgi:predicted glycogen debranching enzyme
MIIEHDAETMNRAPTNAWNLYVGPDICQNLREGFDHEWLVTNGLGGYGAGAINGATTRSYHGLLVAALHPPVERTVLVTKIDEEVTLPDGQIRKLGVNKYKDGTVDPQGYQYLQRVGLEGDIPYFIYRLSETLTLEKRIWMEYGQNTTYVQYMLQGSLDEESEKNTQPLMLNLLPFCLSRDYHATTQGAQDWHFLIDHEGSRYRMRAHEGAPPVYIIAGPTATFTPTGYWYWHVFHVRDSERGLPDAEDVYQPGIFHIQMIPGQRVTLVLSAESDLAAEFGGPQHEELVAQALSRHYLRIKQLLTAAAPTISKLPLHDPVQARLVVAADEFIVARPDYANGNEGKQALRLSPDRKTIIAGYPWFTDWGRDSMISLPGLMLSTGRYSEARGLLKAFASFTHDGLIPNRFPDGGAPPEYNTTDATLWMFHAIHSYLSATGDWTLLKELFPVLSNIIQWHVRGTDYGIGVDPADGLLRAGAPGVQLTWMDAKVDERVVTPRRGKPVEVNALWYCALTYMESWAVHLSTDATQYSQLRSQVSQNFAARFWYEAGGYLYDVVDVDGVAGQNDTSLRPNQLFAASLTHNLLSEEQTRSMFKQVTAHLLTPMGLRSLSPTNSEYHNHFNGDRIQRDNAYHQGAVWPWLIGPYIDVHLYLNNNRAALLPLLEPLIHHLWVACLGTISEVAEPEPPYTPGGCFAQAWSVAELLRCWLLAAE